MHSLKLLTMAAATVIAATAVAQTELPEVNPLELGGNIISAGSSTVYPLAERIAERFKDEGFSGNITIDSIGTGAGFSRFCEAGEIDIANASRPIKEKEAELAAKIGRKPIEFRVGTDALAVVVSKKNEFVKDVTLEQLAAIFSTAGTWSEVDPSWPNEPIQRFSPGTDSGTFDYFTEEVFKKAKEPLLGASNLQLSEDDNVLVQGIEGSPYAIGYFGYAYFEENADKVRAVSIKGIAPSKETVDDHSYPLARPLFLYSDAGVMKSKPQVAAYLNFFLTFVNEEVEAAGYFPAPGAAIEAAKAAWLEAVK